MEQQGVYERLRERVGRLKTESQDPFFTDYLRKFDQRLIQEKYQLDVLEMELEKSCRMYEQRMASMKAAQPEASQAEAPEVAQVMPQAEAPAAVQVMPQAGDSTAAQAMPQAEALADTQVTLQAGDSIAAQVTPQAEASTAAQVMPQAGAPAAAQVMPQTGAPAAAQVTPQAAVPTTAYVPPQQVMPPWLNMPQQPPRPQKNHEFTIGINVFGTIGVLFVLAALILLGINYMGSLVKELGLYVAGLLVWGIAEFVLKKKSQTLSMIFASLGIGCLYVTTMVNFLYLHNFNALVTILITTVITVVVMFVSRKKDAGILRIICIGACMVSFLMMDTLHMVSDVELLIYMVMIVLVQLLGIFLPVKKWAYGIAVGQMVGTAVFAWFFAISTVPPEQVMELRALYVIGFTVVSMLLMELTVWRMPSENGKQRQGIYIAFGIGAALLVWAYRWCATGSFDWCYGSYSDIEIWIRVAVMAAVAVMGLVFFFLTCNSGSLRWMQGYFVGGAALLLLGIGSDERLSVTITLSVLVVLYKLLTYRYEPLRVAGAVITSWTALAALIYYDNDISNGIYGYVLLGVLLLSFVLMNHWQTFYELLITITTILYISMAMDNDLKLPLVIAVMWLASLLFNNVKRFSGKGIMGFNYTMLAMEISCYLGLIFLQTFDTVIIYVILTVLGLGIIFFTFQPRFLGMVGNWRELVIAGFLTYMVLVTKFELRITSSILLMVVGLFGIIVGFVQRDRKLRIYGLVLCMLMCFKIALFDFQLESLQRIILFLATGVVALVISGIYALMEKKYIKAE